ncbi:hypothetical protein M9H77_05535 [Catharanthus roseus]|uniref:Uncharacterized protein n=1 Tax=Catharanthus roseus TaxID=4058 RepID=A0ACC0CH49_CATRO|nr:hypothetical protein M9H77_05535 [Catharanthus roseus]
MNPNPTFSSLVLLITSFTLIRLPNSLCQLDPQFLNCSQPFRCGDLDFYYYPFWGGGRPSYCGYPGFELSCLNNVTFLVFESLRYRVLEANYVSTVLIVARDDLWDNLCPKIIRNTTIANSTIFYYDGSRYPKVILSYGCTIPDPPERYSRPFNQFDCEQGNSSTTTPCFYSIDKIEFDPTAFRCNRSISVPIDKSRADHLGNSKALQEALRQGFYLEWNADNSLCRECHRSGGQCGYNSTTNSFVCFCSDRPYDVACDKGSTGPSSSRARRKLALATSLGMIGLIFVVAGVYFLLKRYSWGEGIICWKSDEESNCKIEAFIRSYGSLAPRPYSFTEIKKMTGSLAHILGEGGYGSVYKGTLPDGRLVAVKVLKDNKGGNVEEFINEVASISRTSHVNVVTLLGFCYKANTRALVYEFMCNGSLDKCIHKNGSKEDPDCRLEWSVLYQISLGTARGLEYLHQGCNTRIVHFDIKPQNILLDKDFCPKISDFGLAKLCKKKESVLSTMGARGTVGYMAPEVFLRGFGGISHKSDVYSYGMMILDMVGLKGRIQVDTDKSSETYFPNWIYERLELEKDLGLEGVMNAEDEEDARKMIMVGLWCIQTKPSDRPSMSRVVEMLEGNIKSLQIPPKHYLLDSPAAIRSLEESSFETLSL